MGGHRILVVDDEPLIALMLQDWLADLGHLTVGPVGSVKEALRLAASETLHAAILDVTLSDGDCYEVAEALRQRAVPIIFATGLDAGSIDARFHPALTLLKPFDLDMLVRVLDALPRPGA